MDLNELALAEIAFDAGADGVLLPPALRTRVLSSVDGGRSVIHSDWADSDTPTMNALLAFQRTAAELAELLTHLGSEEWQQSTATPAGSVHDLIVHLVGIERYTLGQLGRRVAFDAPTRADHFPVSLSAAHDSSALTDDELARAWWLEAMEVVRACGELGPAERLDFHHLPLSVRGLLVVRTFELWTHGEDIRRANRRALNPLDSDRLALMSAGLIDVLAFGMAMSGTARPGRTARITLTGSGGATFDVALAPGEPVGPPDVMVTMSTIDLCRVAARQLPIAATDMRVEGDDAIVEPLLVGAQAFAAD